MSVESSSYINGLVTTNPTITDPVYKGPDHFWLLKSVLKNTFPGSTGNGFNKAITATEDELNFVHGVTSAIQTQIDAIWNKIYPIGSIYTNAVNATNPATLLGFGTWVRFGEGRVLVSQSSTDVLFDTPEEIGGSKDSVLVSHSHGGVTGSQNANHYHGFSSTTGGMNSNTSHSHGLTAGFNNNFLQYKSAGGGNISAPGGSLILGSSISVDATNTDHTHNVSGNTGTESAVHAHGITAEGVAAANTNIQPYIVVYMWKRTA